MLQSRCSSAELVPRARTQATHAPTSRLQAGLSGSGGWDTNLRSDLDTSICSVDIVHVPPDEPFGGVIDRTLLEQWRQRKPSRPTLFRRVPEDRHSQQLRHRWTKDRIMKHYGELKVRVGSIPYASQFALPSQSVPVSWYLNSSAGGVTEPLYLFEDVFTSTDPIARKLVGDFHLREYLLRHSSNVIPTSFQFYVGGAGTGAPFHFHADAFNFLVHGSKRWFLLKPEDAVYSRKPTLRWFREDYESMKHRLVECVQQAGDVLHVPTGWGHAVLNVQESIGAALELALMAFPGRYNPQPGAN